MKQETSIETHKEIAERIAHDPDFDARLTVADKICLRNAIVEAVCNEREACAVIATKKADTLRKAAHVVQQPTEEALRMAELAILTADDIAAAIRKGDR